MRIILVVAATAVMLSRSALASAVVEDGIDENTNGKEITNNKNNEGRRLKICLMVEPSPVTYCSGYANRYRELVSYLARTDDNDNNNNMIDAVELITTDRVQKKKGKNNEMIVETPLPTRWFGFPVHYTAGIRLPFYQHLCVSMDWSFRALRIIKRMQQKPDVIHVSTPGSMVLSALLASKLWNIPVVMSYHTHLPVYVKSYIPRPVWLQKTMEWLTWKYVQWIHSFAHLVLVTSQPIREQFRERNINDDNNVQVWLKGIDTERFHPRFRSASMRRRMMNGPPQQQQQPESSDAARTADDKALLLVYVGRLAPEKRLDDLRHILEALPCSTRLCLVGDGPERERLAQVFPTAQTVFLGQLSGDDLSAAFASADVFVMPSDSETLGFVVLESMASGVPVVAANAGGIPDLVVVEESSSTNNDNAATGVLVTPGSIPEFVQQIERLRTDPALRLRLAQNGRTEAEQWGWTASMRHLRHVQYPQAIANALNTFQNKKRRH